MSTPTLTDFMSSLAAELCEMLARYTTALTEPCGGCITDISECSRRCASLTADAHARLLAAFCPPLPRAPSVLLCERLHAAVGAVFGASMLLPPAWRPDARLSTEVQSLCRMGELLRRDVDALPRLINGKNITPPDTYAFHAELTRVRAAHALYLTHGAQSRNGYAVEIGLSDVTHALAEAYTAVLVLIAEAL